MPKRFAGSSFLTTFGLVFLAIAALFAADMYLARMERSESAVEATRLFDEGRTLIAHGDSLNAIERIRDALSIERTNRFYQQTLAQTQLAAGKTADAEATLGGLLESDPTDGQANLIMGRVLAKEGRFPEAISYFHRAIYGQWGQDTAQNRLRARFELIDLLAQRDSKEDLLAELLPVQDQVPRDLQTRARMGRLFLRAGSPTRAADIFRGIVQEAPANADGYAGLGESEFAQANYPAAERAFESAIRFAPTDDTVRKRLELCSQLLALDPTLRGLSPAERLNRSRKLVELAGEEVTKCVAAGSLNQKAGRVTESNLDLAEELWQARAKECKSQPVADDPLALVMARLAR
jgi:tetratricopeptide (TPR) repeat protein